MLVGDHRLRLRYVDAYLTVRGMESDGEAK